MKSAFALYSIAVSGAALFGSFLTTTDARPTNTGGASRRNAPAAAANKDRRSPLAVLDGSNSTSTPLKKRYSGQATWYEPGLGACGKTFGADDYIVALNSAQYGSGYPGPQCWKTLTITAKGKSATAKVYDECPTCDYGSLDLTPGLFQHFNDLGVGEFDISWEWGSGGGGDSGNDDDGGDSGSGSGSDDGGDDSDKHTTTSKKKHHSSTSTKKEHSSTSTKKEHSPTTTSSSSSSSSSTSTSSFVTSATTTSAPAAQTTGTAAAPGNLGELEQAVMQMRNLLTFANK